MPAGDRDSKTGNIPAAGIVIWLALQLAALSVSAGRVPLWARAPRADEQSALALMLAVQVAASALMFPHLLGTIGSAVLAIASSWIMGLLASFLSDASAESLIAGEAYVSVWLVSLLIWNKALCVRNEKLIGTAIAGMISIGGPVLWYLRADFSTSAPPSFNSLSAYGPICGAVWQTFGGFQYAAWLELIILTCLGALALMVRARFRKILL